VREGEENLQISVAGDDALSRAHHLDKPRFNVALQVFEIIQKFIANPDHPLEHCEGSCEPDLLVLFDWRKHDLFLLLQVYDDIDVMREIVILSPALILAGDEDLFTLHHLQVLYHRLWTEYEPLGDLGHKARLLPQEFYYPSPVPVSQYIKKAGNLTTPKHVY
jgi:hypothetical protein